MDMRLGTCPICRHNQIIEAPVRDFARHGFMHGSVAHDESAWSGISELYGKLLQYVCRRCGHVQMFAQSPEQIPIDAERETRLIQGPEPDSPYR